MTSVLGDSFSLSHSRSGVLQLSLQRYDTDARSGMVSAGTDARANRMEIPIAGKDDYFRAKGVVVETLPNATFRVKLETGHEVTARASGKMRKGRMIRIIPGDSVEVDVSAYDPTMGRIVWRYR